MLDTLWKWTPMGKLATNSFHHSDFIPGTVKKCQKLATRFVTSLCMTYAPARRPSSQSPLKSVVSLHPELTLECWTPIIWKLNPLWFSSTALPDQLFLFFPYWQRTIIVVIIYLYSNISSPRIIYLRNWRKKSRPSPLKPSHVSNCKNHIILYLCSPCNLFVQPRQSFAVFSRSGCIVWKTVPIALWETCHIQVHQYNPCWLCCVKVCSLIWCANMATRIVLVCRILWLCFCLCLINVFFL